MKKIILLILLLTPAISLAANCPSGNLYVDYTAGSDDAAGTSTGTAWQHSPGDANATGNANCTPIADNVINFKGGVSYQGSITISASGTSGHPITFQGQPSGWGTGKAIIDGGIPLTGWTACVSQVGCLNNTNWSGMFYKDITIPAFMDTGRTGDGDPAPGLGLLVLQDGQVLTPAQYPLSVIPEYQVRRDYIAVPHTAVTTTTLTDATNLPTLGGTDLIGKYLSVWVSGNDMAFTVITQYDSDTKTITFSPAITPYTDRDTVYAVVNVPTSAVFKEVGTQYLDESADRLYVIPYDGVDLASAGTVTMSNNKYGFLISGDYVTIDGFIIQMQSGDVFNAYGGGGALRSTGDYGIVQNCEMRFARGFRDYHIQFFGDGNLFQDNSVHNIGGGGLEGCIFTGDGVIIKDNIFNISPKTVIYTPGPCTNCQIIGNTVSNAYGAHGNSITVYGNTLPTSGQDCLSYERSTDTVLVAGNIVTNSNIATYSCVENVTWYNNSIEPGIVSWAGGTNINLINNTSGKGRISTNAGDENVVSKNNIAYAIGGTNNNIDTNGIDNSSVFDNSPRISSEYILDLDKYDDQEPALDYTETNIIWITSGYGSIIKTGDIIVFSWGRTNATVSSVTEAIRGGNMRTVITLTGNVDLTPAYPNGIETIAVWPTGTTNFTPSYALKGFSPAIEAGINALVVLPVATFTGYNFELDILGATRTVPWDVGAYEYVPGGDIPDPAPAATGMGMIPTKNGMQLGF